MLIKDMHDLGYRKIESSGGRSVCVVDIFQFLQNINNSFNGQGFTGIDKRILFRKGMGTILALVSSSFIGDTTLSVD